MIKLFVGATPVPHFTLKFSGGELQVRIDTSSVMASSQITCTAHLRSADDIMELLLLNDALHREGFDELNLVCPYLPYARQDRVCYTGEALSIKVMCQLLNAANFATVEVWDAHSDVVVALLDRCTNVHQKCFVDRIEGSVLNNCVLVSPDAGAVKKTMEVAKYIDRPWVRADKLRDPKDGSITGTEVRSEHIGEQNFLIVDDICDGGRTFMELAKVLQPLTSGKVHLYVTHGIFSKGLSVFDGLIDTVYTPNAWPLVDEVSSTKLVML